MSDRRAPYIRERILKIQMKSTDILTMSCCVSKGLILFIHVKLRRGSVNYEGV